jgi:hypothetical protein
MTTPRVVICSGKLSCPGKLIVQPEILVNEPKSARPQLHSPPMNKQDARSVRAQLQLCREHFKIDAGFSP